MQWKLDNTLGTAISKETPGLSKGGVLLYYYLRKNTKKTKNKFLGLIITPPFLSMNFENLRGGVIIKQ